MRAGWGCEFSEDTFFQRVLENISSTILCILCQWADIFLVPLHWGFFSVPDFMQRSWIHFFTLWVSRNCELFSCFSMGKENESYPQNTLLLSTPWGIPLFPCKFSHTFERSAISNPAILRVFVGKIYMLFSLPYFQR